MLDPLELPLKYYTYASPEASGLVGKSHPEQHGATPFRVLRETTKPDARACLHQQELIMQLLNANHNHVPFDYLSHVSYVFSSLGLMISLLRL